MEPRITTNFGYFYDALSGEFHPPTDTERRAHTLGRLLLATYEKGDVVDPHSHREMRTYQPSWAPIHSTVHISHWDIHSLTLVDEVGERVMQFEHTLEGKRDVTTNKDYRTIRIHDSDFPGKPVFEQRLGHGLDYNSVRNVVTRSAQDFFDGVGKFLD